MYKFDTLVLFINAVAKLSGITYAEHDWLSSLNDGSGQYPKLIYFVDNFQDNEIQEGVTQYYIRMALKMNQNNGQGGPLRVQDKPAKWQEIKDKFDDFFSSLPGYSDGNVKVFENPKYKPDELSQGNDMLIWVNADVTFSVTNCGNPGPIPEITP